MRLELKHLFPLKCPGTGISNPYSCLFPIDELNVFHVKSVLILLPYIINKQQPGC